MELAGVRAVHVPAAIDAAGAARLGSEIATALADEAINAIVLEGTAAEFCRGMDLVSVIGATAADLETSIRAFANVLTMLAESVKPTVAVVHGPALGGGVGLAAACDIVIASKSATFGLPEGLLGLTPAVIAPVLLERISAQRFKRLALLAEPVAADEAKLLGLIDEVVDDAALNARARRVCTALLRVEPATKRGLIQAIRQTRIGTPTAAIAWGVAATSEAAASPSVAERIRRLLEGEAPWQKP